MMENDIEETLDDRTPLLGADDQCTVRGAGDIDLATVPDNRNAFYLAFCLILLFQAGITSALVPATSVLENAICYRENGFLGDCKSHAVQTKLAMLKGVASVASMMPGLFLTVPYGALADKYGTRRVMVLSLAGVLLTEVWSDLVCMFSVLQVGGGLGQAIRALT
jgi:MFS family permease